MRAGSGEEGKSSTGKAKNKLKLSEVVKQIGATALSKNEEYDQINERFKILKSLDKTHQYRTVLRGDWVTISSLQTIACRFRCMFSDMIDQYSRAFFNIIRLTLVSAGATPEFNWQKLGYLVYFCDALGTSRIFEDLLD